LSTHTLQDKYLLYSTLEFFNIDYPETCVTDIPNMDVSKRKGGHLQSPF